MMALHFMSYKSFFFADICRKQQYRNISKNADFDEFSLLEIRNRKRRSHGKRQKGNDKRKRCAAQKSGTFLDNLSSE